MDSRTIRIILVVVGVVLLVGLACVCLAGFGFGSLVSLSFQQPEEVNIRADVPISVSVDEELTLTIEIDNLADGAQALDSIDIFQSYLDGLVVQRVRPNFEDVSIFDSLGLNYVSYAFYEDIPAGESFSVDFVLLAVAAGDFSGEIDVCINSPFVCETIVVRTIVEE